MWFLDFRAPIQGRHLFSNSNLRVEQELASLVNLVSLDLRKGDVFIEEVFHAELRLLQTDKQHLVAAKKVL